MGSGTQVPDGPNAVPGPQVLLLLPLPDTQVPSRSIVPSPHSMALQLSELAAAAAASAAVTKVTPVLVRMPRLLEMNIVVR